MASDRRPQGIIFSAQERPGSKFLRIILLRAVKTAAVRRSAKFLSPEMQFNTSSVAG
jgi:hypothetical protein